MGNSICSSDPYIPPKGHERPLFESIMPVVVTVSTVLFSNLYFRNVEAGFVKEGILLGLSWLAISVVIDLLLFMQGSMQIGSASISVIGLRQLWI